MKKRHNLSHKPNLHRLGLMIILYGLFTLACGIQAESQTTVYENGSSASSLFIILDKESQQLVAEQWENQKEIITQLLIERGATVTPYEDEKYDGLEANIAFPDLATANQALSGDELSFFSSFSLRRWRGEFIFEAYTNGPYVKQRVQELSSLQENELLLANLSLGLGLQLPGTLVYEDADETRSDGMLFWAINWLSDEEYTMLARSRVPLIPPVITQPTSGIRIRQGGSVDFAGQGEPGADITLYRVQGDERIPLYTGTIDADGIWSFTEVTFSERGEYILLLEEKTDTETLVSPVTNITYRPLPPIVFVPGYYACTKGLVNIDFNWLVSDDQSSLGIVNENSLLNPAATGILPLVDRLVYGPLFAYFDSQGYILNETFFVACYNWGGSMAEEAEQVGRIIDLAAESNTSGLPVTVITHSNGGLVTRYYVQANSEHTKGRIHTVIMIAPPNQGVPRAYYAWEGGDISQEVGATRILLQLAFAFHPDPNCRLDIMTYVENPDVYQQGVYDCLHQDEPWDDPAEMPSVSWLVPDGLFLNRSGNVETYPNAPLANINNSEANELFFAGIEHLVVIAGTNIDTTQQVIIESSPGGKIWKSGKPTRPADDMPEESGDGSVLITSTALRGEPESDRYHVQIFQDASHTEGIVKRADVFNYIAQILEEDFPPPPLPPDAADSDSLIIWVESPIDLLVIDPQGRRAGYDEFGQFWGEIPGSAYGYTDDPLGPKILLVSQTIAGQYKFQVTGLANGDYHLYGLSTNSSEPIIAETGHIQVGEVRTYTKRYYPEMESVMSNRRIGAVIICGTVGLILGIGLIVSVNRRRKSSLNDYGGYGYYTDDLYPPLDHDQKKKKHWWKRQKDDDIFDI